jgi:N-formylglutamate amidohydrolase
MTASDNNPNDRPPRSSARSIAARLWNQWRDCLVARSGMAEDSEELVEESPREIDPRLERAWMNVGSALQASIEAGNAMHGVEGMYADRHPDSGQRH